VGIVHVRCMCCALTDGQILVSNVMITSLSLFLSLDDDDNFVVEFIIIIVKRSNDLTKSGLTRYCRYKCSEVRGNKCVFISGGITPHIFWPWR